MRRRQPLPLPEWKYTKGADWSGHSLRTRAIVEQHLAWLAIEGRQEYRRDMDSPIGKFVLRRYGR